MQDETPCEHLIFLDESGAKTNMTRLYGRAPMGERCFGHAPDGRWKTVTMLSSIRLDGTTECLVFAGALDRRTFAAYVKESLAPALKEGDVAVMDNLRAHKSPLAQQAIEERGARVLFLPAYSPDLCGGVVDLEPRFYGDVWVKRLENGLKCLEKKQKCLKIGGNFNLREI